jgi:predicted AAA+ superfamily ATPase
MSALTHTSFEHIHADRNRWGRLIESAVGAHLLNSTSGTGIEVHYWLDRSREVDFVLVAGNAVVAIEVKSGRSETGLHGMASFAHTFPVKRQLLVGASGIALEEFLITPAANWID